MTTKRTKHDVNDIVIVSGTFYAVPDRVVKVVEVHTKGENKGRIVCRDINGHGYIGHNNEFFTYSEVDREELLWQSINHDHQWLVNKCVKDSVQLSSEDVLRQRIKELEDRNEFLENAMMNLLEKIGG